MHAQLPQRGFDRSRCARPDCRRLLGGPARPDRPRRGGLTQIPSPRVPVYLAVSAAHETLLRRFRARCVSLCRSRRSHTARNPRSRRTVGLHRFPHAPQRHPMTHLEHISDPGDHRIADYVDLRDPELRRGVEAAAGFFVAESPHVIETVVRSGRRLALRARHAEAADGARADPRTARCPRVRGRTGGAPARRRLRPAPWRGCGSRPVAAPSARGRARRGPPHRGLRTGERPRELGRPVPQRGRVRPRRGRARPGVRRPAVPPVRPREHRPRVHRAVDAVRAPRRPARRRVHAARARRRRRTRFRSPRSSGPHAPRSCSVPKGRACRTPRSRPRTCVSASRCDADVDSLNVATAAAVAFYEATRPR